MIQLAVGCKLAPTQQYRLYVAMTERLRGVIRPDGYAPAHGEMTVISVDNEAGTCEVYAGNWGISLPLSIAYLMYREWREQNGLPS